MNDWDNEQNDIGYIYVTIYTLDYDTPDVDIFSYRPNEIDNIKNDLKTIEDIDEHEDIVGINSNSLTPHNDKHNIFMEWDDDIPNINKLRNNGGIITKTNDGYHYIKEANISLDYLIKIQEEWKCCSGFINKTKQNRHSCLRLMPKEDNILRIIKNDDGILYNAYREIVLKMGGKNEYSGAERH